MNQRETVIDILRTRIAHAAGTAAVLAAGFDGLEFIRAAAQAHEECGGPRFATWAMTTADAAAGRNALAVAPSLPIARSAPAAAQEAWGEEETADALADLAKRLAVCLAAGASGANDQRDAAACEHAASKASLIASLLTRGQ